MNKNDIEASTEIDSKHSDGPAKRPLPLRTFCMALVSISLLVLTAYYFTNYVKLNNKLGRSGDWLRNNYELSSGWDALEKKMGEYAKEIKEPPGAYDIQFVSPNYNCIALLKDRDYVELTPAEDKNVKYGAGVLVFPGAPKECVLYDEKTIESNTVTSGIAGMINKFSVNFGENARERIEGLQEPKRDNGNARNVEYDKDEENKRSNDRLKLHSDQMLENLNIIDFVHKEIPELRALWFYAGTPNNSFGSFPAHAINISPYMPTIRPWYTEAIETPGQSGFSDAYIDAATNMPIKTYWYKYKKDVSKNELTAIVAVDFIFLLPEKRSWETFAVEFFLILILGFLAVYLGLWLAYQKTDTFYRAIVKRIRNTDYLESLNQYVAGLFKLKR